MAYNLNNIYGVDKYLKMGIELGTNAIAALFPNVFEIYIMALELVDYNGNTIDYLPFPVMPQNISSQEPKKTTIKNTAYGTTVLTSPTFAPKTISIKGNFGKSFKVFINDKIIKPEQAAYSISAGVRAIEEIGDGKIKKKDTFAPFVNTGYGVTKYLKSIIDKSNGVDNQGRPFKLFFYNLSLNESYVVAIPPSGLTISQNISNNTIWEYSLSMVALAPLTVSKNQKLKMVSFNFASKVVQDLPQQAKNTLEGLL